MQGSLLFSQILKLTSGAFVTITPLIFFPYVIQVALNFRVVLPMKTL